MRKQSFACIVGKPAENDVKLGALKLKPNTKIMMMGTREESLVNVYFCYHMSFGGVMMCTVLLWHSLNCGKNFHLMISEK